MDLSSFEPGTKSGEPNKSAEPNAEGASGPVLGGANEITKVLAYGPAERDPADTSPEAPEVKAPEVKSAEARFPEPSGPSQSAPEVKISHDGDLKADPVQGDAGKAPDVNFDAGRAKPAPDAAKENAVGKALVPFVATAQKAGADPIKTQGPKRFEAMRSRAMQAAVFAACVGIAWAFAGSMLGSHTLKDQQPAVQTVALATPAAQDTSAETRKLSDEIRALKKELDGLRSSVAQNPSQDELRTLKRNVDQVKNGLESTKSDLSSSLAKLSAKLEQAQHDPVKLREIVDRIDHIERNAAAPLTTASIAATQEKPATVPVPPAKAAAVTAPAAPTLAPASSKPSPAPSAAATDKPQPVSNWVVRDVYDGIALVEGPRGALEVTEGETIPSLGTVKSIERRGSGWIVVTSRGLVEPARD